MIKILVSLICVVCLSGTMCGQAIPVEVVKAEEGYQLLRGGEPYFVRGAGGSGYIDLLAASGGNSFRTWGAEELDPRDWPDGRTMSVMDRAHELGLTVSAGFWIPHFSGGYQGGGFDYDDPDAVEGLIDEIRAFTRAWKDHPALLVWGVGNEVLGTDRVRGLKLLNRIAVAIKEIDPDHPTMAVLAGVWPDKAELFAEHCPDVDLLGVNVYGGISAVPAELLKQGYDGPYLLTEYGPLGHWEGGSTDWGAEIEQPSGEKAEFYRTGHHSGITDVPDRCLGGYVFLWGHKQERTDTWYSMILPGGERTPAADVMTEIWTGNPPANRAPVVSGIESGLNMARVNAGETFEAVAVADDHEGDPLVFEWTVKREGTDKGAGGAFESTPESLDAAILSAGGASATVRTPDEPGAYRLQVYARDGFGGIGYWNVPFYVEE